MHAITSHNYYTITAMLFQPFRLRSGSRGLASSKPVDLAPEFILAKPCLGQKVLLLRPPGSQLGAGLRCVQNSRVHRQIFPFPPPDLSLQVSLLLGGVVVGKGSPIVCNGFVLIFSQLSPGICALGQALKIRKKGVAAVPAAQPRAGSVASGFYEIWILTAFPGTAEYSACQSMCSGLAPMWAVVSTRSHSISSALAVCILAAV